MLLHISKRFAFATVSACVEADSAGGEGLEYGAGPEADALGARRAHCCRYVAVLFLLRKTIDSRSSQESEVQNKFLEKHPSNFVFAAYEDTECSVSVVDLQGGLGIRWHMSGEVLKLLPSISEARSRTHRNSNPSAIQTTVEICLKFGCRWFVKGLTHVVLSVSIENSRVVSARLIYGFAVLIVFAQSLFLARTTLPNNTHEST